MDDEKSDYEIWLDTLGNITVDTGDINTQQWDDWIQQYTGALDMSHIDISSVDISYPDNSLGANDIKLTGGGQEMLRVAKDGFYVNGVKVKQNKREAKAVYEAFKKWMTHAIMSGELNN
jgi:hypothetical protein